ncbi:hypothetical protein [Gemmatimonas aurantiaca]|uniref:hypothetical protein n=1 Tax=Gemmatimonas aurantiaca TaxID=173480 RepID=UPI00301DB15E
MGRPYASELSAFPETYHWSLGIDIDAYVALIRRAARYPLVAIGSGGSLSAAQFCADWHQAATGRLAKVLTPLEEVAAGAGLNGVAVAVLSAGGRNADIRRAFAASAGAEPPVSWILTGAPSSPLASAAREASTAPGVIAVRPPTGRDGFLATNSLLSFAVLTHRAYVSALDSRPHGSRAVGDETLPGTWQEFAGAGVSLVGTQAEQISAASTLIVLHGYTTRAAAVDLESKCTEAGLMQVQLADFRNFAHGRHHWIAKHPDTAVLALVAPEDERLADRTLALLPRVVPQAKLEVPAYGFRGALRALVDVMRLVETIGRVKGIDPGRPGVPAFGGKLYSLRGIDLVDPVRPARAAKAEKVRSPHGRQAETWSSDVERAIARKVRRPFAGLSDDDRASWLAAYAAARDALAGRTFAGIAFDYDGTLVDASDRFRGPRTEVANALVRLLGHGITLGIASGRGRSAGNELRAVLPREHLGRVLMGYYNGGEVALLADTDAPDRTEPIDGSLAALAAAIRATRACSMAELTIRRQQITLEPHDVSRVNEVWAAVEGVVLREGGGARVVRSSHSIDVLAPGVSKRNLVEAMRSHLGAPADAPILRVGDRGTWPGNDAELLADLDGVSVDEVSGDPLAAWNFAPAGVRGVAATQAILEQVIAQDGVARIVWNGAAGTVRRRRAAVTDVPQAADT